MINRLAKSVVALLLPISCWALCGASEPPDPSQNVQEEVASLRQDLQDLRHATYRQVRSEETRQAGEYSVAAADWEELRAGFRIAMEAYLEEDVQDVSGEQSARTLIRDYAAFLGTLDHGSGDRAELVRHGTAWITNLTYREWRSLYGCFLRDISVLPVLAPMSDKITDKSSHERQIAELIALSIWMARNHSDFDAPHEMVDVVSQLTDAANSYSIEGPDTSELLACSSLHLSVFMGLVSESDYLAQVNQWLSNPALLQPANREHLKLLTGGFRTFDEFSGRRYAVEADALRKALRACPSDTPLAALPFDLPIALAEPWAPPTPPAAAAATGE